MADFHGVSGTIAMCVLPGGDSPLRGHHCRSGSYTILNRHPLVRLPNATKPGIGLVEGVEKGFAFLGHHLTPEGVAIATATHRLLRACYPLYEREPEAASCCFRLELYVKR